VGVGHGGGFVEEFVGSGVGLVYRHAVFQVGVTVSR
jgi:hypothetical protein